MPSRIQLRRGTAAEWTAANPVLATGEPGYETDTKRRKTGDGVTAWTSLPYTFDGTTAAGTFAALSVRDNSVRTDLTIGSTVQGGTATIADRLNAVEALSGRYAVGQWSYIHSAGASGTLLASNNVQRIADFEVGGPTILTGVQVEITGAGEAGCVIRYAIEAVAADGGFGRLIADLGTAPGDAVGFAPVTCKLSLPPGWYRLSATVQGAPTTPPTWRVVSGFQPKKPIMLGTAPATNVNAVGYAASGVTGLIPQTRLAVGLGPTVSGNLPRFMVKTHTVAPKLPTAPLTWAPITTVGNVTPSSIGTDGAVYGYDNAKNLVRSTDGGATWETGANLAGSGESIIYVTRTTAGYVVIRTGDTTSAAAVGSMHFSTSFGSGFSKVNDSSTLGELSVTKGTYSGQTVLLVGEYNIGSPSSARKLWRSLDGGQTWASIRTSQVTSSAVNSHWHGTAIMPSTNRVFASQGDGVNARFSYSDNALTAAAGSVTWTDVTILSTDPLYESQPAQQPVALVPFTGALFGTPDGSLPSGLWSIDPTTGAPKVTAVLPTMDDAYKQFGKPQYAQSGTTAIVAFPDFGSGRNRVYFMGTGDSGSSWWLIGILDVTAAANGRFGVVGPDSAGNVYFKTTGASDSRLGSSLLVAPAPTWA